MTYADEAFLKQINAFCAESQDVIQKNIKIEKGQIGDQIIDLQLVKKTIT